MRFLNCAFQIYNFLYKRGSKGLTLNPACIFQTDLIKIKISNLVHMTITFIRYAQSQNTVKPNNCRNLWEQENLTAEI